jgi:hypothetical protein
VGDGGGDQPPSNLSLALLLHGSASPVR